MVGRSFPGYPERSAYADARSASAHQHRAIESSRRDIIAAYLVRHYSVIIVPTRIGNSIYVPVEDLFQFTRSSGLNVGQRFLDDLVNQGTRRPNGEELNKVYLGVDYFLHLVASKPKQTIDKKSVSQVPEYLKKYCIKQST